MGCTSSADLRPDVYISADNLLGLGVDAYKKDQYQRAKKYFTQVIKLYQSIADERGIYKARLNLTNTVLAYSDFVTAKTQIKLLKQQNKQGFLDAQLQRRLILAEVKFYFLQQDYAAALKIIHPLVLQSTPDLILLATLARLEVLDSAATKMYWMNKFEQALTKESIKPIKLQLILKRLLAYIAYKKNNLKQAKTLLNQLLTNYQQQANRRGIADCLESIAELELASGNQPQAVIQWKKALAIRLWLKDEYKVEKIQKLLSQEFSD
jgi:tetratricopeptide (TPR) repeat protein